MADPTADHDPDLVDLDEGQEDRALHPPAEPATKPYDPEPHRDKMRGYLAVGLGGILAFTVVFSFLIVLWRPDRTESVLQVLGVVFAPLVALVGAATGYYFGTRARE